MKYYHKIIDRLFIKADHFNRIFRSFLFSVNIEFGLKFFLTLSLISIFSLECIAAPYLPANNEVLVEISNSKKLKKLKSLAKSLKQDPGNLEFSFLVAKGYIKLGKTEGDPRYYSYANAALKYWQEQKTIPNKLKLLLANIKQYQHQFKDAIKLLSEIINDEAGNQEALLMRASIYNTRGQYIKSEQDCKQVIDRVLSTSCQTLNLAAQDQVTKAYQSLSTINTNNSIWATTIMAELAERLGKKDKAEEFYQKALNLNSNDIYLLSSYSDFLLRENRAKEVLEILKNKKQIDNLFLRYLLARKQLGQETFAGIKDLEARFAAESKRGTNVHQREEAIFNLKLLNKPKVALELAEQNFRIQKEWIDLQLLKDAKEANR